MMKRAKLFLTGLLTGSFLLLFPAAATAQSIYFAADGATDASCDALKEINPDGKGCGAGGEGVNNLLETVLNLLSIVAGVIAVIMIIVSGLKYVTSQGDAQGVSSAKKTLIYAIVGIIIVAFAQFIVKFVLQRVGNAAG